MDIPHLLKAIEAHCKTQGIRESTFGFQAVNDGKFVARLRGGASITLRTLHRVQEHLHSHSPALSASEDAPSLPQGKENPPLEKEGKAA